MKIVTWDEFKTLPEGTVFQEYSLHDLGSLQVLGEILGGIDFVCADLLPVALTSEVFGGRVKDPFVIAHPSGVGRDGIFDHKKRAWLIWEAEDRARLARWLLGDAAEDQNRDDGVIYPVEKRIIDLVG